MVIGIEASLPLRCGYAWRQYDGTGTLQHNDLIVLMHGSPDALPLGCSQQNPSKLADLALRQLLASTW